MNYKKAFKCNKCPQSNDENGCPVWTEMIQQNLQTGEERIQKMCGFQAMPIYMVEVIKASNRPAEEMSRVGNQIAEGFRKIDAVRLSHDS